MLKYQYGFDQDHFKHTISLSPEIGRQLSSFNKSSFLFQNSSRAGPAVLVHTSARCRRSCVPKTFDAMSCTSSTASRHRSIIWSGLNESHMCKYVQIIIIPSLTVLKIGLLTPIFINGSLINFVLSYNHAVCALKSM